MDLKVYGDWKWRKMGYLKLCQNVMVYGGVRMISTMRDISWIQRKGKDKIQSRPLNDCWDGESTV